MPLELDRRITGVSDQVEAAMKPFWRQGTRKAIKQANEALAIQRAQLDDMPFEVIEGWLMMQGFVVVSRDWHRRQMDALPFGWPPLADNE